VRRVWEVVRVGFVAGLVALCASTGIDGAMNEWRSAETAGQRAASATELLYGVLSIAVLLAMAFRPRWVTPLLVAWGGALTVTGALAAVVWGGAEWWAGAIGGAGVLAVVALVLWAWRAHVRGARAERSAG